MDNELRAKIDMCSQTAETFTSLYYNAVDKRRHQVSRLYLDNATYIWNGNPFIGKDKIQSFFLELPASEHNITTLDAQPIIDESMTGTTTVIIKAAGTIKYQDQPTKAFCQTFVVTAVENKWKIASDIFRLQEVASDS
ncbi:NTF2-related export protein [Teleopsis dalmanni]|uniref:NTF2-related export protein-like n=1 Tax=Teleopsis dalmanni TaxID=139649 RepID=UPI0018CD77C6|nr:NTF2-related export protein-like [Teleopsis dalmanni]XP_037954526.1 NTF2-related export protein [Teleopsis dalmanni]